MTPWHEYLMDLYITSKILIAILCIPSGLCIACFGADTYNFKTLVCGFILAFLGVALPALLPAQQILIKLLGW